MSDIYTCPDCGCTSCASRGCGDCTYCIEGYEHEPGCLVDEGNLIPLPCGKLSTDKVNPCLSCAERFDCSA